MLNDNITKFVTSKKVQATHSNDESRNTCSCIEHRILPGFLAAMHIQSAQGCSVNNLQWNKSLTIGVAVSYFTYINLTRVTVFFFSFLKIKKSEKYEFCFLTPHISWQVSLIQIW